MIRARGVLQIKEQQKLVEIHVAGSIFGHEAFQHSAPVEKNWKADRDDDNAGYAGHFAILAHRVNGAVVPQLRQRITIPFPNSQDRCIRLPNNNRPTRELSRSIAGATTAAYPDIAPSSDRI
jgi:hypothetical protein